ncbi:MAG: hypothetical protein GPOALKHO_001274 [Sodalis sp.]|nr:MAG: hypothetical protein GPOALKHO_001274 [Sodalis sp.]
MSEISYIGSPALLLMLELSAVPIAMVQAGMVLLMNWHSSRVFSPATPCGDVLERDPNRCTSLLKNGLIFTLMLSEIILGVFSRCYPQLTPSPCCYRWRVSSPSRDRNGLVLNNDSTH